MSDVSLIVAIASPFITAAFVIGVMRGMLNGTKDAVHRIEHNMDKVCNDVDDAHRRITKHVEVYHTTGGKKNA